MSTHTRRILLILAMTVTAGSATVTLAQTPAQGQRPPVQLRVAKTWTDHTFVGSDGTRFHYVEQGQGVPVILIHGLTSSAVGNYFNTGIAQKIARTNRVIAMDMRGHGETGPSPANSTGTMINDIIELMDHLKIQKAHIGGYSMGGATTAGLLKAAPERFITAAVMGIGIRETPEWEGKTPRDPAPAGAPARAARPIAAPTEVAQAPARGGTNLTPNAQGVPGGAPRGAPVANQDVDLTKIKFPVIAINGSNDNPLAKTHRMWRELQDFTYVVVPGRNHMQTSGDPLMGDRLAAFIAQHNPK